MEWLGKPEPRPASRWDDDFGDTPRYASQPETRTMPKPEYPVRPAVSSAPLLQLQPGDGVRHSAFGQGWYSACAPWAEMLWWRWPSTGWAPKSSC